jgi:putative ABC transport system substrate-binding protein
MKRRAFIAGAGAAAAWPLTAFAQPKAIPRIGIVGSLGQRAVDSFKNGLRDFGLIENETIVVLGGPGNPDNGAVAKAVSDFISQKIDLIFASGAVAGKAAKQATSATPIVCLTGDLVGTGQVQSLASPGGNVTGVSILTAEVGGKRLELLKQFVPALDRVAVLYRSDDVSAKLSERPMQKAAIELHLVLEMLAVHGESDLGGVIASATKAGARGIALTSNPLFDLAGRQIAQAALQNRLAAISFADSFPRVGGLMSYGPNIYSAYRRAAYFVSRILGGTRPEELPVEQPTKFDLVVNMKIARTLGLSISDTLLASIDEVIE